MNLTFSALCTISYGKLKIKVAGGNEAFLLHGRSTVAATRDSSYLNQDGDIFKLYKPAISADAPPDSISFESLRYPGTFLRANIRRGSLDFRMDRPLPGDLHFSKYYTNTIGTELLIKFSFSKTRPFILFKMHFLSNCNNIL